MWQGCTRSRILGYVGRAHANIISGATFAWILSLEKVTHTRPPTAVQPVWAAGQVRLKDFQFKTSLILAKNGRKPDQGGTAGRRGDIDLGCLFHPGDDRV